LLASTAVAALLGALPGVAIGLLIAYGDALSNLQQIARGYVSEDPSETWTPPPWLALSVYVLAALVTYAGALAAVSAVLRWRLDAAASITVGLLARTLPLIVVGAIGLTVLFAATQRFSTDPAVIIGDLLVPAFALTAGVAGVRVWAVRRASGTPRRRKAILGETAL
jgi:hypothetical protein